MLRNEDLALFSERFATAQGRSDVPSSPAEALGTDDQGLLRSEVWRLSRSLQIASLAGDVPRECAIAADLIARALPDGTRFASLDATDAWERAIVWARTQPTEEARKLYARQRQVGLACARLRQHNYRVDIGAYGPEVPAATRRDIAAVIDGLIRLIGGIETAQQICQVLRESDRLHDGMWLFGERMPGVLQTTKPTIPYGWLFSLALRHAGCRGTARKPEVAWRRLISLAIDLAAVFDCQRYGPFEQLEIAPNDIPRALVDALLWREIFALPQAPPLVISHLRAALADTLTPADEQHLPVSIAALLTEIDTALQRSADGRLSLHPRAQIELTSPLLWRLSRGQADRVNQSYLDPLSPDQRNHDRLIFFDVDARHVATLPRSMLTSAACEVIFQLIWSTLPRKRANTVVGAIMERAIARACEGKAPIVKSREVYYVGSQVFEIDAATRDGDRFVLVETKAKSLTAKARTGNLFRFLSDYSDSYLAMLQQLARHEAHLRAGVTPLSMEGEQLDNARPVKVAISPLSFGPVSDKTLASSLVRAYARNYAIPLTADPASAEIVDGFNKAVKDALTQITRVAPKRDGVADLFAYVTDVFWVDLGQFLYVMDRALSAWDAFYPLRHITFSTRDFWTEVAFADRSGLTAERWRPARQS